MVHIPEHDLEDEYIRKQKGSTDFFLYIITTITTFDTTITMFDSAVLETSFLVSQFSHNSDAKKEGKKKKQTMKNINLPVW